MGKDIAFSKEDKGRGICFPLRTEILAELFGILTGDGYLSQKRYGKRILSTLEITGNKSKDKDYLTSFVALSIYRLFSLYPHFYSPKRENTLRLVLYSKGVVSFLHNEGFPLGLKGGYHSSLLDIKQ